MLRSLFVMSMMALSSIATSSETCDTVLRTFKNVGCSAPNISTYGTLVPGWAGQVCSGISKYFVANSTSASYLLVGILFSEDGRTMKYRSAPQHQNRSYYLEHQNNWSAFTTVLFDDYTTLRLYDNQQLTFGFPQSSADTSQLYARGFQNTGMYFTDDFRRMEFVAGVDYVSNDASRDAVSYLYPRNFFGTYAGYTWVKDPFFFAMNGNVDEDTVTTPYFTCYTHSSELPPVSSQEEVNRTNVPLCDDQFSFHQSGIIFCSSTINGGMPCVNSATLQCLQLPLSNVSEDRRRRLSNVRGERRRRMLPNEQQPLAEVAHSHSEQAADVTRHTTGGEYFVIPDPIPEVIIPTAPCSVVYNQYVDAGCTPPSSLSTTPTPKAPGWAGKLCTGIGKYHYRSTPVYNLVGFLFSSDGSTFKYRNAPQRLSKNKYLSIKTNWSLFTTILFDDYPTLRLYDNPYVTYGMPHTQCTVTNNFGRGLHNTGMYFNDDFSKMQHVVGLDYLTVNIVRKFLAYLYPRNYFGSYDGLAWVKDPYYFAQNGDVDEDVVSTPYFTCVDGPGDMPSTDSSSSSPVQTCDGYKSVQTNGVWTCNSTTVNDGEACIDCDNFKCGTLPRYIPMNSWWND